MKNNLTSTSGNQAIKQFYTNYSDKIVPIIFALVSVILIVGTFLMYSSHHK